MFALFWWYDVIVFFSLFSHVFEEIFMTLGCLKWPGRKEIVNGELERSQLLVCTVVEMKVLLDFETTTTKLLRVVPYNMVSPSLV